LSVTVGTFAGKTVTDSVSESVISPSSTSADGSLTAADGWPLLTDKTALLSLAAELPLTG